MSERTIEAIKRDAFRLVDFPEEMFNDAMFFLEEAKKLEEPPLRWRFLRASILYSFTSLEAYINAFIKNHLKSGEFAKIFEDSRISLKTKIDLVIPVLIGKSIDKSDLVWKNFIDIKRIRKRLAHYMGDMKIYEDEDPDGVHIKNAEKGIQMVRDMIKYINTIADEKYPHWIDQTKSKIIR